ncbi:MAG: hypothetical protein H0X02_08205 [Nitrosomonas sp.]|nr:hypothetical protein [Nitrosomonas sp.]
MRVNPKTIQALALFVAKKDLRVYMHDINFELQLDKTILTASNGHILLSVCIHEANEEEDTFRIPPASFPKSDIEYEVTRGDDGKVYVTNGLAKVEVPQDQSRYPDFRRVIPSKRAENVVHQSYDPEYLMLFKKASKLLGGTEWPIVHPNNIVDIGLSNMVGVQMPLRYENIKTKGVATVDVAPDWLLIPEKVPAPAAATVEQPAEVVDSVEQKAA